MKFTDGNWMLQPGVRMFYPGQAHRVEANANQLEAVATRQINHRGDTLDGPVLNVKLSSPAKDIICVSISHFVGAQMNLPQFPITEGCYEADIAITDSAATITSGSLSAAIDRKGSWAIRFEADGKNLTCSGNRALGLATLEDNSRYLHDQLELQVGDLVYGLGERFTAFVKNGQSVETWNKDGGAGSEQAYKSVPFYITNRGYGVFVNHPGCVSFEVATEKVSRVQFSVPGESLEYYVIYGPTPKEILARLCNLTGMPALPPAWSFGLWLTTSFTTSYDEQTVTSFIQGMADRDLPLHVFHFDCFWMREFHWCDFEWDPRVFPDPAAMLVRLNERGLKICVWINPYIAQTSRLFEEAKNRGYLIKRPNGDVWQTDQWQAGMGIVDFTNPGACEWYQNKLKALLDMGVDCFKTDFGERIPIDVNYFDGSDPHGMHNYFAYLYNKTVFDLLRKERGESEATLFARSATACCQQFPVHWGGDCFSNFESMAASLRGGLSLSLSGFGFWSHDIGGFEGTPPVEVYKRWIAFGLLSTHSRLHGSSSYRVPWVYDDEAVDVLRAFTKLKCQLMPYLFQQSVETTATGVPVMRAMVLEFPCDRACETLDRQYMLGSCLLVAPVFTTSGEVDYYLPDGEWTDLFTREVRMGPGWRRETYGFLALPLLVRPNTLLAIGARDDVPDYDYCKDLLLKLYALGNGETATTIVPDTRGASVLEVWASRVDDMIAIKAQSDRNESFWRMQLINVHNVRDVTGAVLLEDLDGVILQPILGTTEISIKLN